MCKPVEYIVKNIKSFVVIGGLLCGAIAFIWTLAPRISALEAKYDNLEARLTTSEKDFALTSTRLETTLLQIQSDLQIIKQKLLSK